MAITVDQPQPHNSKDFLKISLDSTFLLLYDELTFIK